MKTKTISTSFFINTAGKYLSLVLMACLWQSTTNAATQPTTGQQASKPEEITIFGMNAHRRLQTTQKKMFELYNSLNSNDDNDIHCDFDTYLGTKIKHWTCDVVFMEKEAQREMDDYLFSLWANGPYVAEALRPRTKDQLRFQMRGKIGLIFDEMRELSRSHPELYNMVQDYTFQKEKIEGKSH